ncbi:MAG: hypothetical protein HRK26_04090 [Rickettsiaceae bacterium H1]|nr:hypothetical protein [Rickettsiaceae bacterium H1]
MLSETQKYSPDEKVYGVSEHDKRTIKQQEEAHRDMEPVVDDCYSTIGTCTEGISSGCGHPKAALPIECGVGTTGSVAACLLDSHSIAIPAKALGGISGTLLCCFFTNCICMMKHNKCYSWVPCCGDKTGNEATPNTKVSEQEAITQQPRSTSRIN